MKKLISILLVVAMVCIALASCGTEAEAVDATYISLRINPEIELVADEDGEVIYANAVNDDGEVVLSTISLEGMSIEEAGVAFTDAAVAMGYVDPNSDDTTVYVDVHGISNESDTEIKENLTKNIGDYFNNNGINGKVSEETLNKYAQSAASWGISTGHVKLVMRVLDAHPELTEEEVLAMEVSQWLTLLNGNKGNSSAIKTLKAEYRETLTDIKTEYKRLFELRTEIEALEAQLENEEASEQDKEAIATQIAEKQSEVNGLKNEYKNAISAAKASYKKEFKELKLAEKKQNK